MKKIILAVASVLALGLFASCQREISGDLNVTETTFSGVQSYSKTYYFDLSGSYSYTSESVSVTKATAAGSEETTGSSKSTTVVTYEGNKGVTLTYNTNPVNNKTTYTFDFPARTYQTTTTFYNAAGTKTNVVVSNGTYGTHSVAFDYIDGKYYVVKQDGTEGVVEGFNPLAATIDLSKVVDSTTSTNVSWGTPDTRTYNPTTGALETYSKTTTKTSGWTWAATLTKK